MAHPAVKYLHNNMHDYYIGGKLDAIDRLMHYDYVALRCTSTGRNRLARDQLPY